jgi:ribosomal protein S18 acetylase RimI-like enzyme
VLSIRAMAAGDLEEVLAIAAAAGAPQWPRSAYQGILNSHPPGESGLALIRFALVCHQVCAELPEPGEVQNGEAPAGFGVVSLLRPIRLAELEIIAVRPELRRRGIGAALLRELVEAARRGEAQTMRLEVRRSNAPAIALYCGQGFRESGRRPGYYSTPAEDALIFEKIL